MHDLDTIRKLNSKERLAMGRRLLPKVDEILGIPPQSHEFGGETTKRLMVVETGWNATGDEYLMSASRPVVTDEMVERFREAWRAADGRGEHGNRIRAGLEAVFNAGA